MPAEKTPMLRAGVTRRSILPAPVLFDLFADPRGCLTWHVHPKGLEVQRIEAPEGLAMEGAGFTGRGATRGVPWTFTARVLEARRPDVYVVEAYVNFERGPARRARQTERYSFRSDGDGTLVTYEVEVERYVTASFWSSLAWRAYDALVSARAMRRGFSELLAAAEREGARSPVS